MQQLIFFLILFPGLITAQQVPQRIPTKITTGNSGTGANIDVKYHRFEWSLNPNEKKNITGSVTTYFITTQDNVKTINFDLNKNSFNNSALIVKYHGKLVSHSFPSFGNMDILNITLPKTLPRSRLDSITISYAGAPPGALGQAEGFQQKEVKGSGTSMIYTLSESYEDKDWWPCKSDMQDKIDSVDFIITTPVEFRAAANGILKKEITSGENKTYYFQHRYPIASYLISVAVAKYNVFDRGTVTIGDTEMPIDYYITIGRGENPVPQLNAMDFVKLELIAFSEKFGDYPFKKEKYGMYEFGWSGGMEHQTFSAMSWRAMSNPGTIAHELMHQWFGNKVTFATWEHLWLAEGFARYGEVFAGELVPSLNIDPVAKRAQIKSAANGKTLMNYECIIPKKYIENSNTLWGSSYGSSVYERGAMVVSMLRTLVGDETFYQACRNYLNDPALAYGTAVTDDLQAHFEKVLDGFDLTPFFDSWVRGNGYPSYSGSNAIKWAPTGNGHISIEITEQIKSNGSNVEYYFTPISLRVQGREGEDTLIVVYDQRGMISKAGNGIDLAKSKKLQINLGFEPKEVTFDPYSLGLANGSAIRIEN
ncbi:MAG: M1 family metallopeptidase [Ginsengibacter sp.]